MPNALDVLDEDVIAVRVGCGDARLGSLIDSSRLTHSFRVCGTQPIFGKALLDELGQEVGELVEVTGQQARAAMDKPKLQAIADRGYFSGPQIKACEEAASRCTCPNP